MTALLTRAELHRCNSQRELAWPLVEEAAGIAGDRSHLLPDAGLFERLQRQFYWATRGYKARKSPDWLQLAFIIAPCLDV